MDSYDDMELDQSGVVRIQNELVLISDIAKVYQEKALYEGRFCTAITWGVVPDLLKIVIRILDRLII